MRFIENDVRGERGRPTSQSTSQPTQRIRNVTIIGESVCLAKLLFHLFLLALHCLFRWWRLRASPLLSFCFWLLSLWTFVVWYPCNWLSNRAASHTHMYTFRGRGTAINNFVASNVFISCHPISKDSISRPHVRLIPRAAIKADSSSPSLPACWDFLFISPPPTLLAGWTSFSRYRRSAINLARIVNFKHFIKQTKRKRNRLTIIAQLATHSGPLLPILALALREIYLFNMCNTILYLTFISLSVIPNKTFSFSFSVFGPAPKPLGDKSCCSAVQCRPSAEDKLQLQLGQSSLH